VRCEAHRPQGNCTALLSARLTAQETGTQLVTSRGRVKHMCRMSRDQGKQSAGFCWAHKCGCPGGSSTWPRSTSQRTTRTKTGGARRAQGAEGDKDSAAEEQRTHDHSKCRDPCRGNGKPLEQYPLVAPPRDRNLAACAIVRAGGLRRLTAGTSRPKAGLGTVVMIPVRAGIPEQVRSSMRRVAFPVPARSLKAHAQRSTRVNDQLAINDQRPPYGSDRMCAT